MTVVTEIWVNRENYGDTKIVEHESASLGPGQVRVAIQKFALTSNNVTYAVAGDRIGYWKFFPAEENWGKVTVWGIADVVESTHEAISVGERLYGFFPMSNEVILNPGRVADDFFMDSSPHRAELAAVYNQYRRLSGEPAEMQQLENERCLYFPLFITSYVLADYLSDNEFFGAEQVIVGSVSSKTGFGLAKLLHQNDSWSPKVVGLTSSGNVDFVKGLDCCDEVVTYEDAATMDPSVKTAWVDMSGDGGLTEQLHKLFNDNMVESCMVGATHWQAGRIAAELPGATPTFFFAPAQIAKRDKEWGGGVLYGKAAVASVALAQGVSSQIAIEHISGAQNVSDIWKDLVDYRVAPSRGIMASV